MNYKMIRHTIGIILLFEAGFMAVPMLTAVFSGEWRELLMFAISAAACLLVGKLLSLKKPADTTLYSKEGFVIAALAWIVLALFGSVPFVLTGVLKDTYDSIFSQIVNALFETVSGFTTTGSSIFPAVAHLPRSVLIWRSFTHWVGGMGVLVFVMAFLPLAGGQNMHIMKAESPGPDVSKFVPKVRETALILYGIYFSLTLACFLSYWISGFTFFEALCNAFSTAGTGGFGIRNDSYASMTHLQQWLAIIFMLLFAVNFNAYYLILLKRIKEIFNAEFKTFGIIIFGITTLISVNICTQIGKIEGINSIGDGIRHAAFYVASIVSTTGFATVDYNLWPTFSQALLMLVLFIGACAGSTGGGFKVSRVIILLKGMKNELNKLIHPRQVKKITMDKKPVDSEVVRSVNAFLVAYVLVFVVSVCLVSIDGQNDIVTNVTAVMTALSNVGPGLSSIGPVNNFAHLSNFTKIVLSFDMLAGRLELFPMLILLSPSTYRNKGF
jgi:trk system potassium uptake protein TrkH